MAACVRGMALKLQDLWIAKLVTSVFMLPAGRLYVDSHYSMVEDLSDKMEQVWWNQPHTSTLRYSLSCHRNGRKHFDILHREWRLGQHASSVSQGCPHSHLVKALKAFLPLIGSTFA